MLDAMIKPAISFSLIIVLISTIISCSKKENTNNPPPGREKYAWVVGSQDSTGYGMILFSSDAGNTWVRQGQNTAALQGIDVVDVFALDENNVWAVGTQNTILRTLDGGKSWTRVPAPAHPAHPELMSISIVFNTNIWISGSNGAVYNSTDAGNTWTVFDTNFFHSGGMQGICAITQEVVYVTGGVGKRSERGFIARTMNGGTTWDTITLPDDYNKNEWIGVTASDIDHIVVYGGQSHFTWSTDGGATWHNDSLDVAGGSMKADINHMIMLDALTWWAAMDEGHIYMTGNGGSAWDDQSVASAGGMYLVGIDAWDSQYAITVGESNGYPPSGIILNTANGGSSWNVVSEFSTPLQKVSFIRE